MRSLEKMRAEMTGATMQIKVVIPVETYRELVGHARARNIDVGELVSRLAKASIHRGEPSGPAVPELTGRARPRFKITPEKVAYARKLHDAGMTWKLAAAEVGVSVSGLFYAMKQGVGR